MANGLRLNQPGGPRVPRGAALASRRAARLCGPAQQSGRPLAGQSPKGARMLVRNRVVAAVAAGGVITTAGLAVAPVAQATPSMPSSYIGQFHKLSTIASTIPRNGDLNPYGMFVIRHSAGRLHAGDVLISNFNAKSNFQGTGSTIVEISPSGHRTLFAHIKASALPGRCPGGVGLSTALEVLRAGWAVVGTPPPKDGLA